MSTRTLIEINHDFLPEAQERLTKLLRDLRHAGGRDLCEDYDGIHGVRVIAQRHHSEPFYISVPMSKLFAEKT